MTDSRVRGESIRLESVSVSYGAVTVLESLSLAVGAGEFFTLLGPSGCGKTTTLRLVAGLLGPSAGRIWLGDRDVTRTPVHRRGIAMVFQNYALMPHLSVRENVGYGLRRRGLPRHEQQQRTEAALARVGLAGYGDRHPAELSGGQQQRVGLARAVAVESGGMLLDEPLSNLDTSLRQEMCIELRELQQQLGVTILYVTHDRSEALSMSDRIAVMSDGQVLSLGTPQELYTQPGSRYTARMLGDVNELRGEWSGSGVVVAGTGVGAAAPDGATGPARIGVRPEHLAVVGGPPPGDLNALPGKVRHTEYGGAMTTVLVALADSDQVVSARVPSSAAAADWEEGDQVSVCWRPEHTMVFTGEK